MESGYRSRRSSLCASLVPIGRSADREMVSQGEISPWLWVAAVQHRMCGDDGTHAAVDGTVYRRCGQGSRRSRILRSPSESPRHFAAAG